MPLTLEDYIRIYHSTINDEYFRFITPFYYEPGVLYHPITNGYNCGIEGSNVPFKIIKADYLSNGDCHITLENDKGDKFGANKLDIHKKFKRIDETIAPIGNIIPNSKRFIYIMHNNERYIIHQSYSRHYSNNRLGASIIVTKDDEKKNTPYFHLYSHIGDSKFSCKTVKSYDNIGRENYDFYRNITVREFKKLIFGDSNIKFKCYLFS